MLRNFFTSILNKISDVLLRKPIIIELLRFAAVGILCTCIDYIVYILLAVVVPYQVAAIIGYAVGFIVNYFLTAFWTFHRQPNKKNFIGMFSCHLINLFVIRIGLITLLVEILLIDVNIAYIYTIIISSLVSFLMMRLVFNKFSKDYHEQSESGD